MRRGRKARGLLARQPSYRRRTTCTPLPPGSGSPVRARPLHRLAAGAAPHRRIGRPPPHHTHAHTRLRSRPRCAPPSGALERRRPPPRHAGPRAARLPAHRRAPAPACATRVQRAGRSFTAAQRNLAAKARRSGGARRRQLGPVARPDAARQRLQAELDLDRARQRLRRRQRRSRARPTTTNYVTLTLGHAAAGARATVAYAVRTAAAILALVEHREDHLPGRAARADADAARRPAGRRTEPEGGAGAARLRPDADVEPGRQRQRLHPR